MHLAPSVGVLQFFLTSDRTAPCGFYLAVNRSLVLSSPIPPEPSPNAIRQKQLKHHRRRFGACLFAVDVPTLWRPQMRHVSLISVEAMTLEPRRLSLCLQIERKAATSNVLLGQTR
jgi:hypothetical protein